MKQEMHLTAPPTAVEKARHREQMGHSSCVIWLTGLSGAGKSTLANALEEDLFARGIHTYLLDGDRVRTGLNKDLGFAAKDREENIRRIAEVAKLFVDAGVVTVVAFISPFRADRDRARALFADGEFVEVFVDCPIEVCAQRDPKGLYRKAREGVIAEFTGITSPYEPPLSSEVHLRTDRQPLEACVATVAQYILRRVAHGSGAPSVEGADG